jgi:hypothetical protein
MRRHLPFIALAALVALAMVYGINEQPGYTDSFYHYNAAVRLARGEGFIDDYLWVYIGAPDSLPAPSHLYWMPFTSLLAALGMSLFGVSYAGALVGFALCTWGAGLIAYWLGWRWGASARFAWASGLMTLFGGFYMRFWGATDTFAPYAVVGAGALLAIGLGAERQQARWWALAGLLSALGHLTRNDGLLLVIVGVWVLILQRPLRWQTRAKWGLWLVGAYLLGMSAWFYRMWQAVGAILPVGGTQGIWFTTFDDLFNYPPNANPQTLFADGAGLFLQIRLDALWANLQNLLAVEGFVFLAPFMLWQLWQYRKEPFWAGVFWFALGIHLAFTLVFPLPGVRGGLFHAGIALHPFWIVLGLKGIEGAVHAVARRRRHWSPKVASAFFTWCSVLAVLALSLSLGLPRRELARPVPSVYAEIQRTIAPNARVMINDVAQFYYYTGLGGVVLPNASVDVVPTLARIYGVRYMILEFPNVPRPLYFDDVPPFLRRVPLTTAGDSVQLYEIALEGE